jgi:hypothetical protein
VISATTMVKCRRRPKILMPCDAGLSRDGNTHVQDKRARYLSDGDVCLVPDGLVRLPCAGPVVLHPSL